MEWWDAVVVGGGPAGSLAAHELARAGARVAVIEAKKFPRYKTCGGGVVWRTWKRLPLAAGAVEAVACRRAEFNLVDAGYSYTVHRDEPIVVMTMRSELDAALLAAAEQMGATIRMGRPVDGVREIDDGIEVTFGQRSFRTRFVIAADGAASKVRQLAGWPNVLPRVPAIEWDARVAPATQACAQPPTAQFYFGLGGAGYAWIFPKRDQLSAGALSTARDPRDLRGQIEEILRFADIQEPSEVRRHGYLIPYRDRAADLVRGRVLLVGDAAGLADPLTWEGIGHACASGEFAATSLLATNFHPQEACAHYESSVQREILPQLRWASFLARILYGPAWFRRRLFNFCGAELCEAMTAVVTGEVNYRDLVLSRRTRKRIIARSSALTASIKLREPVALV